MSTWIILLGVSDMILHHPGILETARHLLILHHRSLLFAPAQNHISTKAATNDGGGLARVLVIVQEFLIPVIQT